jgi:hypothetical protein
VHHAAGAAHPARGAEARDAVSGAASGDGTIT